MWSSPAEAALGCPTQNFRPRERPRNHRSKADATLTPRGKKKYSCSPQNTRRSGPPVFFENKAKILSPNIFRNIIAP
jgi:hypothetical protein